MIVFLLISFSRLLLYTFQLKNHYILKSPSPNMIMHDISCFLKSSELEAYIFNFFYAQKGFNEFNVTADLSRYWKDQS